MKDLYTRLKDKYPYACINQIGYFGVNSNGIPFDAGLNSVIDIPITSFVGISNKGALGTKKVIILTAIKLVKLYREHRSKFHILEDDVSDINDAYRLKTFKIKVDSTHQDVYRELTTHGINNSIALLAQLYYHKPKLFKETWKAYNYFLTHPSQPRFSKLLRAGKEHRQGESVFDRALYHYTKHMNNKGEA